MADLIRKGPQHPDRTADQMSDILHDHGVNFARCQGSYVLLASTRMMTVQP